jgi:hypothetical protein
VCRKYFGYSFKFCLSHDEFGSAIKARVERGANRNSAPKRAVRHSTPVCPQRFFVGIPHSKMVRHGISHLTGGFFFSIEGSAKIGHLAEDNVRTFDNSCPKLHGKNVLWQNFETTFRKMLKSALQYYECHGIRHFANKCLQRQRRRGKTNNSPGKENPSERSKSQGIRLNPGY